MAKPVARTYTRYTLEAARLLGLLIRHQRIEQRITVQALAERAGISRGLLARIEKGDPKCELGAGFELAALLGISLFQSDVDQLRREAQQVADHLALLPKAVHTPRQEVRDDF